MINESFAYVNPSLGVNVQATKAQDGKWNWQDGDKVEKISQQELEKRLDSIGKSADTFDAAGPYSKEAFDKVENMTRRGIDIDKIREFRRLDMFNYKNELNKEILARAIAYQMATQAGVDAKLPEDKKEIAK